jgi:hypothetical protein
VTLQSPPRKIFTSITTTTMMTTTDAYVTYNAPYKVLICRQHKYAVPPDAILRHFRDCHHGIPLPTRQAIFNYSRTLDLAAPEDIVIPQDAVERIKELGITEGFQCVYNDCSELRGTNESMEQHCRKAHGWVTATGKMWRNQTFQTIFEGNRRK